MKKGCLVALGCVIPGLALLIAASYFILNPEKKSLTPETRAGLPGQFIALADGVTHYELAGPEDGPVVVLVDGRIVEEGSHDELMERRGTYCAMFTEQFERHRDPTMERMEWVMQRP